MVVVHQTQNTHDDNYSPQSPDPSELSSISTPPTNVSAFNNWETSYTSTDDNTFYTSNEPRRVYWDLSSDDDLGSSVPRNPSVASSPCFTPAASKSTEKEDKPGNVLSQRRGSVAAHLRSLRADDPNSKGHPRSIKQKIELCQYQTYLRNY